LGVGIEGWKNFTSSARQSIAESVPEQEKLDITKCKSTFNAEKKQETMHK
jgi:hypothetical protein